MNTLTLPVEAGRALTIGKAKVAVPDLDTAPGTPIVAGVRAEDLVTCDPSQAWFTGELAMVERLGGQTFGYLDSGGERMITVEFERNSAVKVGDVVSVKGEPEILHLFDQQSGRRLN
jgi:alpha-glucoside transport system ATP-binding protein